MKRNMNVIQIKGLKGIIMAVFIVTCLAAGFIAFPGIVAMYGWNTMATYFENIPSIGIFQGVLLWGIIVALYFILRRDRVVVCMRSSEGLSEEELKSVFADIKKQSMEDPILQAMMRARDAELKLQTPQDEVVKSEQEQVSNADSTKV